MSNTRQTVQSMHIADTAGDAAVCGANGTIWNDVDWKAADTDQWFVRCKRCDQMTSKPGSLDALKTERDNHALEKHQETVHISSVGSKGPVCGTGGSVRTEKNWQWLPRLPRPM